MSLSLLASFNVSEISRVHHHASWDWPRGPVRTDRYLVVTKMERHLKICWLSLVDIFFFVCFALPCSVVLKCVNLFITCRNKKIQTKYITFAFCH